MQSDFIRKEKTRATGGRRLKGACGPLPGDTPRIDAKGHIGS